MTQAKIAKLEDRGVVAVAGEDASKFLQGLITNDVSGLMAGRAIFAGLLSPQGKILFEFLAVRTEEGFLLDCAAAKAADLARRLSLYKLRAKVDISDQSDVYDVLAEWGPPNASELTSGSVRFADPRQADLGRRVLFRRPAAMQGSSQVMIERFAPWDDYDAHRIALGVPEGGKDYDFGDAYPHEADFDIFNGVSFSKGCYVGQEIVARMQHKTVVRKRAVPVVADGPLPTDRPDVVAGDVMIGKLGSVAGTRGLAFLRLDRAAEAAAEGKGLSAGGISIRIDPPAWLKMPIAEGSARS